MADSADELRASSALFYVDFPLGGRVELSDSTVLGPLDAREASRVRSKLGDNLPVPLFRLEHFFTAVEDESAREGTRRHIHAMSLLAIACLVLPEWHVVVVDRRRDVWERLSFRLSQRGAQLLRSVGDRVGVFEHLRSVYKARSQLVHGGTPPDPALLAWFLAFLRAALPAMAALSTAAGSHDGAVKALTKQALRAQPEVEQLADIDGWWNVVPADASLA